MKHIFFVIAIAILAFQTGCASKPVSEMSDEELRTYRGYDRRDEVSDEMSKRSHERNLIQQERERVAYHARERENEKSRQLDFEIVECRFSSSISWRKYLCSNPEYSDMRMELEDSYRSWLHNKFAIEDSGETPPKLSFSPNAWKSQGGQKCEIWKSGIATGMDDVCLRREINWIIDELSGGTTVAEATEKYKSEKEKVDVANEEKRIRNIRNALHAHNTGISKNIGNCLELSGWGNDVYCYGNKIATVDQVKNFTMYNAKNDSGSELSDVEKRELEIVIDALLYTYKFATNSTSDPYIRSDYGDIILEVMGLGVRINP